MAVQGSEFRVQGVLLCLFGVYSLGGLTMPVGVSSLGFMGVLLTLLRVLKL